jgi:hypothetical protein
MWNYRFEISCFKPIKELFKKHQLLYAVYMLFIRWNCVVGTSLLELCCIELAMRAASEMPPL